jgi:cell wall-associated NlpC family hydrolase
MNGIPMTRTDPLGGLGREGLAVAGGLALLLALPLLALLAVFGGVSAGGRSGGAPSPAGTAAGEIPPYQLAVMQAVGSQAGIPWQVFAAIAKVESDFGRNMATSSAGAVGYGQFLPATWVGFGRGGDPYDYRDVIPAMARYLLAHGAPADLRRAVYAYNHSWAYVDQVLAIAVSYGWGQAGPANTGERALAAALAQWGKPYLFGAVGPDAFDCSGLVQWAYRQAGVLAPRTAQQQFDWARPLAAADLRPGDLIFFTRTSSATSDRITQVGIYAGGGQMVVAPQAGEVVRLESVDSPYWRAHVAGFGRPPLPAEPDVRAAGAGEVRW